MKGLKHLEYGTWGLGFRVSSALREFRVSGFQGFRGSGGLESWLLGFLVLRRFRRFAGLSGLCACFEVWGSNPKQRLRIARYRTLCSRPQNHDSRLMPVQFTV